MKGRSLEEIDEMFIKKVPVKKFKTYHSTLLDSAALEVQQNMEVTILAKTLADHVEEAEADSKDLESQRRI